MKKASQIIDWPLIFEISKSVKIERRLIIYLLLLEVLKHQQLHEFARL